MITRADSAGLARYKTLRQRDTHLGAGFGPLYAERGWRTSEPEDVEAFATDLRQRMGGDRVRIGQAPFGDRSGVCRGDTLATPTGSEMQAERRRKVEKSDDAVVHFGTWVQRRRLALGLKQNELAARAFCSTPMMGAIERGDRSPGEDLARSLAAALELPESIVDTFVRCARHEVLVDRLPHPGGFGRPQLVLTATPPPIVPTTALIGREHDIAELCRLIRTGARLVTLTGMGGCGKTRLAVELAAQLRRDFTDRDRIIALSEVSDPELVPAIVASSFGVVERPPQSPAQALADYLRPRHLLLVVDNCEHLIHACVELVDLLLQNCSDLYVLVTSREPLRVPAEVAWPVALLDQPSSVALFCQRASGFLPGFQLTAENTAAVEAICHRLGGLPLAVELAAARLPTFITPAEILVGLDHSLSMLSMGFRNAPERHQTLRATLDWSHSLLSDAERAVFRRLAPFAGASSFDAVEAVCAYDGRTDLLEALAQLVAKSMVLVHQVRGQSRYRLLEPVRQYAQEHLAAADEGDQVRRRHAAYYTLLARDAESNLHGPAQRTWLDWFDEEHENIRAALQWAIEGAEADVAGALGASIWQFWQMRALLAEGRRWLTRVLAFDKTLPHELHAKLLNGAGVLALVQAEYAQAGGLFREALRVWNEPRGDRAGAAWAMSNLGWLAHDQGAYVEAAEWFTQSLRVRRELNDKWGIGCVLGNLGMVELAAAKFARARKLFEASGAQFRSIGDQRGVSQQLKNLGYCLQKQGSWERAQNLFVESLQLDEQLGDSRGIGNNLSNLGSIAYHQQDWTTARKLWTEAVSTLWELGDLRGVSECLEGLAACAVHTDQPARAAHLFGAAAGLRDQIGAPLPPWDRRRYATAGARGRAQLGARRWEDERAAGMAMTLDRVIRLALERTADRAAEE